MQALHHQELLRMTNGVLVKVTKRLQQHQQNGITIPSQMREPEMSESALVIALLLLNGSRETCREVAVVSEALQQIITKLQLETPGVRHALRIAAAVLQLALRLLHVMLAHAILVITKMEPAAHVIRL